MMLVCSKVLLLGWFRFPPDAVLLIHDDTAEINCCYMPLAGTSLLLTFSLHRTTQGSKLGGY